MICSFCFYLQTCLRFQNQSNRYSKNTDLCFRAISIPLLSFSLPPSDLPDLFPLIYFPLSFSPKYHYRRPFPRRYRYLKLCSPTLPRWLFACHVFFWIGLFRVIFLACHSFSVVRLLDCVLLMDHMGVSCHRTFLLRFHFGSMTHLGAWCSMFWLLGSFLSFRLKCVLACIVMRLVFASTSLGIFCCCWLILSHVIYFLTSTSPTYILTTVRHLSF